MNLERFLNYITHHSESIIQWIFLAIVLQAAFLIARALFGKKSEAASSATPGPGAAAVNAGAAPELQSMLDKILAQTAKLESLSLKEMSPADVAKTEAQVAVLRKNLTEREEEIARLKASGPITGSGGAPGPDTANLANRIKELENKLAEYEILEDDIADLSLYKDENSRLKAELDQMKQSGGSPAPTAPAAAATPGADQPAAVQPAPEALQPSPAPAPAPEGPSPEAVGAASTGEAAINTDDGAGVDPVNSDALLAEFAQAVGEKPPGLPASSLELAKSIPDTGNPMADFENTVELERQLQSAAAQLGEIQAGDGHEPKSASSPIIRPPSPSISAPPAAMQNVSTRGEAESVPAEDLFAEFAADPVDAEIDPSSGSVAAVGPGDTPVDGEVAGSLDTDKMLAEMASLTATQEDPSNALEEAMDLEKMVLEAKFSGKS